MNPLEGTPDQHFQLTLANPNPTAGKNKQGAWYRVSFELTPEEHEYFMAAELKGMVLECMCSVTHANTPERDPDTVDLVDGQTDREKKRGGPLSVRSDSLARDPEFCGFIEDDVECHPVMPDDARLYIREYCGVGSRAQLDHDAVAAKKFHELLSAFTRWGNG